MQKKNQQLKHLIEFVEYKIELTYRTLGNIKYKLDCINLKIIRLNYLRKEKEKEKKKEREHRHSAPANKEWNNSVYLFNKNPLLDVANKDKIASTLITSYFNMIPMPSIITKSKRMRDLLRRSSTRQLFVSEPEIKQTNDNVNITVYTFDREKRLFFRKLFFLRKWLNENLIGKKLKLKKSKHSLINKLRNKKIIKKSLIYKKHIIYKKKFTFRKNRNIIKTKTSKFNVKNDLYIKTVNMLLKKRKYFVNIFIYVFLKRIFSFFFKRKLYFLPEKNNSKRTFRKTRVKTFGNFVIRKKGKRIIRTEEGKIRHVKHKQFKLLKINKHLNLKKLRLINMLLFKFILSSKQKQFIKNYILIFNKLKTKYEQALKRNFIKKEVLIIKYLYNLYINKHKYYAYLPGLKSILSKIYNKKIKFNLVKLKNVHLNSDIFSEAISIKLRERTTSLLRILRKSFNFVSSIKPNKKYIMLQKKKNFPSNEVKTFFGKYNVINGNVINKLFNKMYSFNNISSIKGVLKSVKYKWVTGVRIEAKGRLTKRYAASRALFKYKYRGTLRNLEYLNNTENYLQSPGVFMLRGDFRPNTQYSLVHSKRRIGAFGIKGWISNS